jgi:hypothetical protein
LLSPPNSGAKSDEGSHVDVEPVSDEQLIIAQIPARPISKNIENKVSDKKKS